MLPVPAGRIARPFDHSAYTSTPSGRSPAQSASACFGLPGLRPRPWPPLAVLVVFVAFLGASVSFPLPAAALPRTCLAVCGAMRRRARGLASPAPCALLASLASGGPLREPRRRVSLNSTLGASPRSSLSSEARFFRSSLRLRSAPTYIRSQRLGIVNDVLRDHGQAAKRTRNYLTTPNP